jgi:hypothetical protein
MGNGFSNGSKYVDGHSLREVSPTRDAIVAFMLSKGIDVDIDVETILFELGLAYTGGGGFGVYTGRINAHEQRKGSKLRIVPGCLRKSFRLTQIR